MGRKLYALRGDKKNRFVTMFDENEDGKLSSAEVEFRRKKMKIFRIEERKERLSNRLNKKLEKEQTRSTVKLQSLIRKSKIYKVLIQK